MWPRPEPFRRVCANTRLCREDERLVSRNGRERLLQGTQMRLNRGDRIAGVDGLHLRDYFRRQSDNVNCRTLMEEFSMTKRKAQELLDALLKLKMISRCEFQHDKTMVSYETTIQGNALGMAKAGKPVKRASAGH